MGSKRDEGERIAGEVHHLERVAEAGESGETPAIVGGAVWLVTTAAVLVILALSLLAYRLAT
jgi:hypothetical protein